MEQNQPEEIQKKQFNTNIFSVLIAIAILFLIFYFSDKQEDKKNNSPFGVYKDFKTEWFSEQSKREVQSALANIVLKDFRDNPNLVHTLLPTEFENFVALILIKQGYDIEVTPRVKDGGKDIIAKYRMPAGHMTTTYVECKKYSADKKVGVQYVRSLCGTVNADRVNSGILVTSSTFTKGARDFQSANNHLLHLIDFNNINEWLLT